MALETILATVVVPAVVDLVKSGFSFIGRKMGGGVSIDDKIKLDQSDISKMEALAKLENPFGVPSQWVVDLRASFRYVSAGVLILGGLSIAGYGAVAKAVDTVQLGLEVAGMPFLFIFGERMWNNFTGKK